MSIIKLLSRKINRHTFTTPSHSQKSLFSNKYETFYNNDYSEIEGFDNLSNPNGAILLSQGKVSKILNTKQTFFITQGATTALLIAMKSILNPNDKVLVARNCHKSIYNGLVLTNAIVDWFIPNENLNWGIYEEIDPKKLEATLKISQYKAFIITSPTYEGNNSNIKEISRICKSYNVILIVDEAHGSLYNFNKNLPKTAIEQGADISVNSLHKTAGALNQTALLNISLNSKFELDKVKKSLNLFHTTSPSYPLLANIEASINFLNSKKGNSAINNLINQIDKFKKELKKYDYEFYEADNHDSTKLILRKKGMSGNSLSEILFEKYNIEDEMCGKKYCLFLTGIGTSKKKIDTLKNTLKKIKTNNNQDFLQSDVDFQPIPLVKLSPFEAFNRENRFVSKKESLFQISNQTILPYPPGIGLLYPGEIIQEWHLKYLNENVEIIL